MAIVASRHVTYRLLQADHGFGGFTSLA